jgi:hypothetical protein
MPASCWKILRPKPNTNGEPKLKDKRPLARGLLLFMGDGAEAENVFVKIDTNINTLMIIPSVSLP